MHRNAAIFELVRVFDHILLRKKIDDWYIKRFKSYRVHKQIETHPDTHTHKHYW